MIKCAYKPCKNKFEPKTHNQKYCSDECCKIATNLNIKKKYQDRKDRLAGKKRICKNKDCYQELGRYQEGQICNLCLAKERERDRQDLLGMLNGNFK
jgi:hypothetical protein